MTGNNLRPLDGITVVSLEQAVAAPFCSRHLADLGARVIKIERPGEGDFARGYDKRARGLSSYFVWANRSKESLTLDVKHPDGQEILFKLLEKADVLIQNLAPGAAQRLGLSYDALQDRFPGLILCNISGYGAGGPYEKKKAYDLLIQSEAGFLSVTGKPGPDEMIKAGISIADISAAIHACNSILAALLLRGRTGRGSVLDISMLETMVEWMGSPLYYSMDGASPPPRAGAAHATIYPYGPFPVGEEGMVMLGLQNEREWAAFCTLVLQLPELREDQRFASNYARSDNRAALREIIVETFARLGKAEVMSRMEQAGIASASVNKMQDIWNHKQLQERQRWVEVGSPAGPLPALLPPGTSNAFSPRMDPIPALGADSDNILAELGYSADRIAGLRQQETI